LKLAALANLKRENAMKTTARVVLAVSILGLGFGHASAAPYDGNAFSYQYPIATGRDVTAVAVDFVNSRFRHQRVTGPGVIYRRNAVPYYW
jgi:hypothetical protein